MQIRSSTHPSQKKRESEMTKDLCTCTLKTYPSPGHFFQRKIVNLGKNKFVKKRRKKQHLKGNMVNKFKNKKIVNMCYGNTPLFLRFQMSFMSYHFSYFKCSYQMSTFYCSPFAQCNSVTHLCNFKNSLFFSFKTQSV